MELLPGGYLTVAPSKNEWAVIHVTDAAATGQEAPDRGEHLLATFESRPDAALHACTYSIANTIPFGEFSGYWINPVPGDDPFVFQRLSDGREHALSESAVGVVVTDEGKVIEILPLDQILETHPVPGHRYAICRDDVAWEHYCLCVPELAVRAETTQEKPAATPATDAQTESTDARILELERKLEEALTQSKKNVQMIAAAWRSGRIGALTKTFGPLRVPTQGMTVELQSDVNQPFGLIIRREGSRDSTLTLTQAGGELTLLFANDGAVAHPIPLDREAPPETPPPAP